MDHFFDKLTDKINTSRSMRSAVYTDGVAEEEQSAPVPAPAIDMDELESRITSVMDDFRTELTELIDRRVADSIKESNALMAELMSAYREENESNRLSATEELMSALASTKDDMTSTVTRTNFSAKEEFAEIISTYTRSLGEELMSALASSKDDLSDTVMSRTFNAKEEFTEVVANDTRALREDLTELLDREADRLRSEIAALIGAERSTIKDEISVLMVGDQVNLKNQVTELITEDRRQLRDELSDIVAIDRSGLKEDLSRMVAESGEVLREESAFGSAALKEEVAALKGEITAGNAAVGASVREAVDSGNAELRKEIAARNGAVREAIDSGNAALKEEVASLKGEITAGSASVRDAVDSGNVALNKAVSDSNSALNKAISESNSALNQTIADSNEALKIALSAVIKDDMVRMSKDISDVVRRILDESHAESQSDSERSASLIRQELEGGLDERRSAIEEHVHRECVKVYKNVQASTQEMVEKALSEHQEAITSMVETTVRGQNETLRSNIQGNMVQVMQNAFKSESENQKKLVTEALQSVMGPGGTGSVEGMRKLIYFILFLLAANLVGVVVILLWIFMII